MALVDHSPHHPDPVPKLPNAERLLLIDNYDSFTWNVYQYLCLEGATVIVYRNDEKTLEDLIAANPTQLVVSPGPGHPDTDSGISTEAIKHFAGKIPVLGVCMGEQCIYSAFGGDVEVTGQILHGKTSKLRHDGKGIYAGLPQDLPVTRYHSLAGTHPSLPDCLEVSSWIASGPDGGKGVIMGVRHKELLVEGVQFHPESILTAEGRSMLKNFLKMKGGRWVENSDTALVNGIQPLNGANSTRTQDVPSKKESILEKIYRHRKVAVEQQKYVPSQRPSDLQASYDLHLFPPQISFPDRLRATRYKLSLMAEVKRASPSKGIISLSTCAPAQAREYALAGADVISVLTEPEWFKGSIEDLRAVRQSLEGMPNRPAVLRKEFIFDEYQILEARLAGADTVLLIVKMLDKEQLRRLYEYSCQLGMEPLVEVNTVEEMEIARNLGAIVIGVNNRNLTNFEVDLETTTRLMDMKGEDAIVAALSGISGPKDVETYTKGGVDAVLVGEALMRAENTAAFVEELLGSPKTMRRELHEDKVMVKICGTRSAEAARAAVEAGADMIGIILVEGRKRCIKSDVALAISKTVHETRKAGPPIDFTTITGSADGVVDYFAHTTRCFRLAHRALLVGVFQDQPLEYVLAQQALLNLDVVQLHGSEPVEWATLIPVPVIHRFGPNDPGLCLRGYHALPLLDSASGGTGQKQDLAVVRSLLASDDNIRLILAGGLNSENVQDTIAQLQKYSSRIAAVDVSSGVEDNGIQSLEKIRNFIAAAKSARGS